MPCSSTCPIVAAWRRWLDWCTTLPKSWPCAVCSQPCLCNSDRLMAVLSPKNQHPLINSAVHSTPPLPWSRKHRHKDSPCTLLDQRCIQARPDPCANHDQITVPADTDRRRPFRARSKTKSLFTQASWTRSRAVRSPESCCRNCQGTLKRAVTIPNATALFYGYHDGYGQPHKECNLLVVCSVMALFHR